MKMSKEEYEELMAHFYFLEDKVDEGYKRETTAVVERLAEEYRKFVDPPYWRK